jgi:hypothetical protein
MSLIKVDEGADVKVGRGDFSRSERRSSLLLLLIRRKRRWVFWLKVRAGDGEARERGGEAILLGRRDSLRDSSGEMEWVLSSPWTTVRLLEEPEWYERGLVTLPAEDFGPVE